GERELRALRDHVDELGLRELAEVESLQERKLLQPHRACAPRPRLADGEPSVLVGDHRLEDRLPAGQVLPGQQAALGDAAATDLLRHEALVEETACLLDLRLARPAPALLDD